MTDPSAVLKVLSDPTRTKVVEFLARPVASCCSRDDGVCACDLEELLGLSQPTVSHHMRQLVEAGVVRSERRGRWVYYSLEVGALRDLAAWLEALAAAAERLEDAGPAAASPDGARLSGSTA